MRHCGARPYAVEPKCYERYRTDSMVRFEHPDRCAAHGTDAVAQIVSAAIAPFKQ